MTSSDSGTLGSAEFDRLFDTFAHTAVRLEALPVYAVGGAEEQRIQAWRDGQPRPERSVRTDPWLARIALTTITNGRRWSRVRVVDDPLTEYERYELYSYVEAQAVGDVVTIARREDVGQVGTDVWLFDTGTPQARAVLMHYTPSGQVDRRELVTDPDLVEQLAVGVREVAAKAVPLNEFLALDLRCG